MNAVVPGPSPWLYSFKLREGSFEALLYLSPGCVSLLAYNLQPPLSWPRVAGWRSPCQQLQQPARRQHRLGFPPSKNISSWSIKNIYISYKCMCQKYSNIFIRYFCIMYRPPISSLAQLKLFPVFYKDQVWWEKMQWPAVQTVNYNDKSWRFVTLNTRTWENRAESAPTLQPTLCEPLIWLSCFYPHWTGY